MRPGEPRDVRLPPGYAVASGAPSFFWRQRRSEVRPHDERRRCGKGFRRAVRREALDARRSRWPPPPWQQRPRRGSRRTRRGGRGRGSAGDRGHRRSSPAERWETQSWRDVAVGVSRLRRLLFAACSRVSDIRGRRGRTSALCGGSHRGNTRPLAAASPSTRSAGTKTFNPNPLSRGFYSRPSFSTTEVKGLAPWASNQYPCLAGDTENRVRPLLQHEMTPSASEKPGAHRYLILATRARLSSAPVRMSVCVSRSGVSGSGTALVSSETTSWTATTETRNRRVSERSRRVCPSHSAGHRHLLDAQPAPQADVVDEGVALGDLQGEIHR